MSSAQQVFSVSGCIVPERDALYDEVGMQRMRDSYLTSDETSPQERLWNVAGAFGDDEAHSARLYEYLSRHWLSAASPILSYAPKHNKHGLPISCYLIEAEDTIDGLIRAHSEACQLSVMGGGVSVKMNARENSIMHIKHYDAAMLTYRQANRRGATCMYMDIGHIEIYDFIEMRRPTGDENMRARNINHAVNLTDEFMQKVIASIEDESADDTWTMSTKAKDEHGNIRVKTMSAKELFMRIIHTRLQTGEPYICFIDACNRGMNAYQKALGMAIQQSNLCTEVIVPTNKDRSSMCCLSSFNLVYYDEFSADKAVYAQFVEDVMRMLDNVITVFGEKIEKNPYVRRMQGAVKGERNIGMGVMGLHSYLQRRGVALDDLPKSQPINEEIFRTLKTLADASNAKLGAERGSPSDIEGSGMRFAYTLAIAPTATSSIIMGNTSPSIEPFYANAYTQKTLSGVSKVTRNRNLQRLFESKNLHPNRIEKLWSAIISDQGSVQGLGNAFLTPEEKRIYRTFQEVDQMALVKLAANRQPFIDQGQSLSLFYSSDESKIDDIVEAHLFAWASGLKTMYYLRSTKAARNQNLTKPESGCTSCEA